MKPSRFFTYLLLLVVAAGGAIWYIISDYYARQERAQASNKEIVMFKNPSCQCCDRWASYMRENGFKVTVNESRNLPAIKEQYGIPQDMAACHTAFVGGYIVEGHVPAEDVKRLLKEHPKVAGLAVPGMPASSPGMNTALNEPFRVFVIDSLGHSSVFAQH